MSLHDELTEIQGVGDATAEKILAVVDAHDVSGELEAALTDAVGYHEAGQHEYAEKFVRRAYAEVE